jgi:hypothetical protein
MTEHACADRDGPELSQHIREVAGPGQVTDKFGGAEVSQPRGGRLALFQAAEQALSLRMTDASENLVGVRPGARLRGGPAHRHRDLGKYRSASRLRGCGADGGIKVTAWPQWYEHGLSAVRCLIRPRL